MIDRWIVDSEPSARYPIFTRGNVGEVFPDPVAPLSGDIIKRYAEYGWRDAFVRFGAFDADEFDPDNNEVIGIFGGYCYLNVSISRILGRPDAGPHGRVHRLPAVGRACRACRRTRRADGREPGPHRTHPARPSAGCSTTEGCPSSPTTSACSTGCGTSVPISRRSTTAQLVDRVRTLTDEHFRRLFGRHLFTSYCATVPVGIIQGVLRSDRPPRGHAQAHGRRRRRRIGRAQLRDVGAFTTRPSTATISSDSSSAFLSDYGARGPNEWEMRSPTWETDPQLALVAIEQMRRTPDDQAPRGHQQTQIRGARAGRDRDRRDGRGRSGDP